MLTPAEADYLRSLPERIGNVPASTRAGERARVERRARLQRAGLITVHLVPAEGHFLVMLTPAGTAALEAMK